MTDTLRQIIREIALDELSKSELSSKSNDLDAKILDLQKQISNFQKAKEQLEKMPVTEAEENVVQSVSRDAFIKNPKLVFKIITKNSKIYWLNAEIAKKDARKGDSILVQNHFEKGPRGFTRNVAPGLTSIKISDIKSIIPVKNMFLEAADPTDAKRDDAVKIIKAQDGIRKLRDSGAYAKLPITKFAAILKHKYNLENLSVVEVLKVFEKIKIR